MVMTKVRIAELKARLSEHLRRVRRGHSLIVLDRDNPVAKIVPILGDGNALTVREPLGRYPSIQKVPLPPPLKIEIDVVDLLLAERQVER
jgi:prevent-host-death family protein